MQEVNLDPPRSKRGFGKLTQNTMNDYNPFDLGTPIPPGYKVTNANTMTLKTENEIRNELMTRLFRYGKAQHIPGLCMDDITNICLEIFFSTRAADHQAMIEEMGNIVREETPYHVTREYRDTDAMKDRIFSRLSYLKGDN